jgi:hypothetical protein
MVVMGRRLFLKPSHLATASAVLSASAEDGLTVGTPVSGASNRGALRLRASAIGAPTAATALDGALQAGGLANGFYGLSEGVPGAALRWRTTGAGNTEWLGHTDNAYVRFSRLIAVGSAATDYPCVSEPRALGNGSVGFLRTRDGVTDGLEFLHKATATAAWTVVTVATVLTTDRVSVTVRPSFVVLPSGRLVAFAYFTDTATVDAFYSDDHGAAWSSWSTATRIAAGATNATICAEVTGDAICVVTGGDESGASTTLRVYWSIDAGQTFTQTASEATMNNVRTCVTASGQVLLATSADAVSSGDVYPVLFGGGLGASLVSITVRSTRPAFALCAHDDGTLWLFENAAADDALTAIGHRVSIDNGGSFTALSSTSTIYDNGTFGGTPRGPSKVVAGSWNGSIILLLTTDCVTANLDNGIVEMHLGGYDSLTETYKSSSPLAQGTNLYGALSYIADDLPDNLGWTNAPVGAGATITQSANGLNIVSTLANNTNYTIDPGIFTAGDGFRMRYVFRVNAGGNLGNDVSVVGASHSDTVNRQWWKIRHGASQLRLVDNSGNLATTALVIDQFTAHTEVLVAWLHDYTAGAGRLSVWYRIAGATHWTALATSQAIAEEAGVATEEVSFGGTSVASTVDWDVSYIGLAEGAANLHLGFSNPTDLHGRPLSAAIDFPVKNGVRVGGFGGPGVQGDTFTISTGYQFAARNIWLAPRLPCRWSSGSDNTTANVVFYSSGNTFRGNVVTVHGSNIPRCTMEWAATDSWGAPAYSIALSAEVWSGAPATVIAGTFTVSGTPWTPHQFRSEAGRRWFVEVTVVGPTVTTYEIDDNDENALYVDGLPVTVAADTTLVIFGDRMGAVLPTTISYPYMRLSIGAVQTADNTYRVGFVVFNVAHEVSDNNAYDSGFVDRYVPQTRLSETTSGHVHVTVLGPEHPELRIAWGLQDRASSNYLERVVNLFRALRGDALPVVFWRNTDDVSTIGLFRVQGPPVKENAYGELSNEFARMAQLILREETT